jgi:hypothetical protein
MSESYSESNAVPEETLSAMAESTVFVFDSDEQVTEQAEDSEAISPDQLDTGKALADVTSKIGALPPFESPDLDAMLTDPLLVGRPSLHVRSAPYDYPGQDNGNASMVPDAQGRSAELGRESRPDKREPRRQRSRALLDRNRGH